VVVTAMADESGPDPVEVDWLTAGGAAARQRLAAALGLEPVAADREREGTPSFDGGCRDPLPPRPPSLASVIRALVEVDRGEVERRARALDDLAEEGKP
jgi:hypothetical protein